MKTLKIILLCAAFVLAAVLHSNTLLSQENRDNLAGDELLGKFSYDEFEKPEKCSSCHNDIYQQWKQAMMSQAYTHHWDEIEYFELAVPHAQKDEKVAGVKAGCNGCHAPISFMAGDVPPPKPSENSRANEAVSCDVCHTITGTKGDVPHNFSFTISPGRVKHGNRKGVESPEHITKYSDFIQTADFCGNCHNEKSPYGIWVKSTHLEWKEGPYAAQGVACHVCHMPGAPGKNAKLSEHYDDVKQHLFNGAHDPGKVKGTIEIRMHPEVRETEPDYPVVISVQLFNGKTGHKFPSGSVEDRMVWLTLEAKDAEGKTYHLPVDKKGFEGEEYTIAQDVLAYQDMGFMMDLPDFKGVARDGDAAIGDRIFRMPYFDPQGRMTIAQWNTASLGTDYRIGPRETKIEKYTWEIPEDIAEGKVTVHATLYYTRLVRSVGEFLKVPADELEPIIVNEAETSFEVYY